MKLAREFKTDAGRGTRNKNVLVREATRHKIH
jgi:hypothetical protein